MFFSLCLALFFKYDFALNLKNPLGRLVADLNEISSVISGAPRSFTEQEFLRYFNRDLRHQIYKAAYGRVGNAEDAQDIVQETIIRAWENFDQYEDRSREGGSFAGWAYTIARNCCRNALQKQKTRNTRSLDAPVIFDQGREIRSHDILDQSPDPEEQFFAALLKKDLSRIIAFLPEKDRIAFYMSRNGCSYEKIAERFGHRVGTIGPLLIRIRIRIRKHFLSLETREVIPGAKNSPIVNRPGCAPEPGNG